MTARDPNVRRALVTRLSEDRERAWVLVEWMKTLGRGGDKGAIQAPRDAPGVEAVAIAGIEVGDEVLVDLRPLPVVWLSFLFFVAPVMAFGVGAVLGHLGGHAAAWPDAVVLLGQMALGFPAALLVFRVAQGRQRAMQDAGLGTPVITAIMPRHVGEVTGRGGKPADLLQAVFFLSRPVSDADWEFAAAEFERISGMHGATRHDDRVEVVFQQGVLKEKHLLELLTMFGFPIQMDRDPE